MGSILVVDDEPALRVMIARGLKADGFTVVLASDGMEAWGLLEEGNGPFDLLVVDIVMPRWDGVTLMRRVKAEYPAQRILLITGRVDRTLDASVPPNVPLLLKPFTPDALVRAARSAMSPRSQGTTAWV